MSRGIDPAALEWEERVRRWKHEEEEDRLTVELPNVEVGNVKSVGDSAEK